MSKNKFLQLLHKAIGLPDEKLTLGNKESLKDADYNEKQTRQHKTEDVSPTQSDKSHELNASTDPKSPQ